MDGGVVEFDAEVGGAGDDAAGEFDDGFALVSFERLEVFGAEDGLGDGGAVAHEEEVDLADFANVVNPAGDAYLLADFGG